MLISTTVYSIIDQQRAALQHRIISHPLALILSVCVCVSIFFRLVLLSYFTHVHIFIICMWIGNVFFSYANSPPRHPWRVGSQPGISHYWHWPWSNYTLNHSATYLCVLLYPIPESNIIFSLLSVPPPRSLWDSYGPSVCGDKGPIGQLRPSSCPSPCCWSGHRQYPIPPRAEWERFF